MMLSFLLALCVACVLVVLVTLYERRFACVHESIPAENAVDAIEQPDVLVENVTVTPTQEEGTEASAADSTPAGDENDDVTSDEPLSEATDSSAATTEVSGSSEDEACPTPTEMPVTSDPTVFTSSLLASLAATDAVNHSTDKKPRRRRRSRSRKATLDDTAKPKRTRRGIRSKHSRPTTATSSTVSVM